MQLVPLPGSKGGVSQSSWVCLLASEHWAEPWGLVCLGGQACMSVHAWEALLLAASVACTRSVAVTHNWTGQF